MPWKETCTMTERRAFIEAWLSQQFTFTRLCQRHNISRKTGYKWLGRFLEQGRQGLQDRPRAPHHHPNQTAECIAAALLETKHRFPYWGPVTLVAYLQREHPEMSWPAPSTVGELLKRHGLVKARHPRRRTPPHSQPLCHARHPHAVWSADFKGDFRLGNAQRCYPLTLTDNYSRFLIDCKGLYSTALPAVKARYERAFRHFGLPEAIRTDNGYPFASTGLGGLSALSVWLLKLGVIPERIAPGHPEQNPRHERMHRTLKFATASPPKANLAAQQRAFNRFQHEYNHLRPHQGLGQQLRPGDLFSHSPRPFPHNIPQIEYPQEFLVRRVRSNGVFKSKGRFIYLSSTLAHETIGLKPLDHDMFAVYFSRLRLGIFDERLGKIIRPDKSPQS